jgi:hypothetical protein
MAERRFALIGHTHDSTTVTIALADLSDVTSAAYTSRFALMADGSAYVGRALVEADISDLGTYLTSPITIADISDIDITGWAQDDMLFIDASGNIVDTAGKLTWSGSNLFVNGTSEFQGRVNVNAGADVRIKDVAGTDYGAFAHDGTNFTLTLVNTGDFIVLGAAEVQLANYSFDVDQVVTVTEDNYVLTYDNADGQISLEPVAAEVNDLTAAVTWANIPDANVPESAVTQHEAALTILESQITDANILARIAGNELITGTWQFEDVLEVFNTGGGGLRFNIGAGNAIELYHTDVSAINTDLAFTSSVNAGATLYYNGETRLVTGANGVTSVYSSGSTDSETRRIEYKQQNGTIRAEVGYDINAPTTFLIENQIHGGLVKINAENAAGAAKNLFTGDPDGDSVLYYAGTATVTAGSAGLTVVGDLTGTTIGGITTANLLDMSAAETVTGQWSFEDDVFIGDSGDRIKLDAGDGTVYWGSAAAAGRLSWDTNKALVYGLGSNALQLGGGGRVADIIIDTSGNVAFASTTVDALSAVIEGLYMRSSVVTTTNLADITHAVNTNAGKQLGTWVFNTTTGLPVWAAGSADGSVWLDATGATAHTPV